MHEIGRNFQEPVSSDTESKPGDFNGHVKDQLAWTHLDLASIMHHHFPSFLMEVQVQHVYIPPGLVQVTSTDSGHC